MKEKLLVRPYTCFRPYHLDMKLRAGPCGSSDKKAYVTDCWWIGRQRNASCYSEKTKRMSAVSRWLNAIFVLNISFQITERKETLFTTFLFSLLCSGYFNEIINEFPFSRFANKIGNKEL